MNDARYTGVGVSLLSREEAAAYLGVSVRSFQRHVQPHVPEVKVGSRKLYKLEDLDAWVDTQRKNREPLDIEWPESAGVYFVQMGGVLGPIKIGSSSNVRKRLIGLRTGCPTPLRLLRVVAGGQTEERIFHERFKKDRREGEWFDSSKALLAFVGAI